MRIRRFSPTLRAAPLLLAFGTGCAASPSVVTAQADSSAPSSAESRAQAARSGPQVSTDSTVNPLVDDREPDQTHPLPELSFKHLGMHIGGESNAPESKEPFLSAISAQEEAILLCYHYVNEPGSPGSFGLDLYVGRSGGAPEIRGVRQKLGGEPFVKCMNEAFGGVRFTPPERPTVLSYSLLFVLEGDDS